VFGWFALGFQYRNESTPPYHQRGNNTRKITAAGPVARVLSSILALSPSLPLPLPPSPVLLRASLVLSVSMMSASKAQSQKVFEKLKLKPANKVRNPPPVYAAHL
jgi:hypothetical protein